MSDNPYSAAKEGALLALRDASSHLGHHATSLSESNDMDDVSIQDVADWIENWQRARRHYRRYYPEGK